MDKNEMTVSDLLHERLREFADDNDGYSYTSFEIELCDSVLLSGGEALKIAEHIERDYIPRTEHDAAIKAIVEAQGDCGDGCGQSAHHVMKVWAAEHDMSLEDGQTITEWLYKWFIKRPVRDDTNQPLKVDDYEDLLTYSVADDGCWFVTFCDSQIEGTAEELFHAPANVLDADGVEIRVGDTVYETHRGEALTVYEVNSQYVHAKTENGAVRGNLTASYLTHQKPVFDADGVRICKGDTVWCIEDGQKYTVRIPCAGTGKTFFEEVGYCSPEYLTHKEPVIGADGKPIKVGETVYWVSSSGKVNERTVAKFEKEHGAVHVVFDNGCWMLPESLTHTPPDTLEKLLADMMADGRMRGSSYITRIMSLIERGA